MIKVVKKLNFYRFKIKCNFFLNKLFLNKNTKYYKKLIFLKLNLYGLLRYKNLYWINKFNFKWYKFSLFIGLGYKKKISRLNKFLFLYIGDRHWLILPIEGYFIFTLKRRNLIIFSFSKTTLYYINNLIKELKIKSPFKLKGYIDARTRRRWIVVRRVRIKGLLTKLSKKQKLI